MEISEKAIDRQGKKQSQLQPLGGDPSKPAQYRMRLFVAGNEPNSAIAQKNINEICSAHLRGDFQLDVIDVFEDFGAAIEENILVTPALVIDKPKEMTIFGNLQDKAKVLAALELL
jgi:circadian clock protein KaiB